MRCGRASAGTLSSVCRRTRSRAPLGRSSMLSTKPVSGEITVRARIGASTLWVRITAAANPPNRAVTRTPADGVGVGFSGIGNADRLKRHESGGRTMAHVADHLSVSALVQPYRSCTDVTAARHFQTIWLLAKGHDLAQVSATVSYARRWVEIPWVRLVAPCSLAECGC